MTPYALDLRQNILRAYDQHLSSPRALAALFGVSHACLEPLRQRRTTGEMAPRAHGGGRQPCCDGTALAFVRHLAREQPDATLEELCRPLQQPRGLQVRVATMCRLLQRLGLPRQNRPPCRRTPHAARPAGPHRLPAADRRARAPAPEVRGPFFICTHSMPRTHASMSAGDQMTHNGPCAMPPGGHAGVRARSRPAHRLSFLPARFGGGVGQLGEIPLIREDQRFGVDTVSQARGGGAVLEHMAEVRIAARA
jgi:transposase